MTRLGQRTLKSPTSSTGVGLHSGLPVKMTLRSGAPNTGIVFVRTDLAPAVEIAARPENVVDTRLATTLGVGAARVGTVEHLLSACYGLEIDNLRVEADGPELPIFDGSAAPFVELIRSAGIGAQRAPRSLLVVHRPIEVRDGDRYCQVLPAPIFGVSCSIDFDQPLLRDQRLSLTLDEQSYQREIARARTFVLRREIEGLRQAGLAKGGSLENAIVIDDFNVLNPEGLRFVDEFVRHKILDLLGDLALCGERLVGHVVAHKSGHALHQRLVQAICAVSERIEVREKGQLASAVLRLTGLAMPNRA